MKKIMLLLTSVMLVLMTSIAFSALSTSLAITSEVKFRPLADIRVNSIELNNAAGGQLAYESDFSKNTVSNGFTLPTSGSSISYRVHIDNSGDVDYSIYDILKTSSDNGLNVAVSGYNVTDVIPAKSSVDLILTYTTSNPSDTVINVVNTMDFRKVYHVTYETGTNQTIPAQVKYEGVDLTLTNSKPSKDGYTFSRWNTKSDGTGTNYNKGATYSLDEDKTLYALYNLNTYNITYVLNGGTNALVNPSSYTIESPDITLADATKEGFVFRGWTGNGTPTPTKNLVLPTGSFNDKEFTAHFADETPPTIEVTNQNKSKNYLTSTYTLNAGWNANVVDVPVYIDAQDVGSGVDKIEYVYSNSTAIPTTGWVETTNGLLTVNKGLGGYYLHVRATDKENNVTTVTTKKITVRYRVAYYDDYSKSTTVTESQYYTGTALTTRTPEAVSGYAFDGWYSSSALTTKVVDANASYTPTTSIKLYGKWTPVTYDITYAMNNGVNNANNPSTYTIESNPIALQAPTKTLTFKGNPNVTSGANAASGTVTIGSDTTKAQTFAGWTGSNGTTAQTSVTIPTGSTGDKSYTAHWTAVAGTVPTVTRTGYTCGWSTTSTGTTIEIASGGSFPTSSITEEMAATVNLYAVCTPNTYQLTINPNGGTYNNTTSNSTKTMTYDSSNNNDIGVPTRDGYTFDGWYLAADNKTSQLFDNTGKNTNLSGYFSAAYSTGVWKKTSAVTVYAHWSKVISSLTNSVSPESYIYDGTAKTPTPTVKDGSTTLTNNTDYSVAYTNNTNVGTATATITGKNVYNSTTKAYYTSTDTIHYYINNAKITFDTNNCGTISGTSPAYVRKGTTGVYTGIRNSTAGTVPTVTKAGYAFNGWYDGTTKVVNANGTIVAGVSNWTDSSSKWLITADKTLKASCTLSDFSITYAMNNGINNENNPLSYNTTDATITLAAPTKTLTFKGNPNATSGANAASGTVTIGENTTKTQTFAGWTGSNGTTPQTTVTIPTGSTGDKSYTAHWSPVAGTLPTVTRTGYTCGWSTTSTGTTITYTSGGTFPTSAITEGMAATVNLYAVCNPDNYTLTINPNGGTYDNKTTNSTKTMTYDASTNNDIGVPTRDGYTFDGWYLAADNKTSQLFDNTGKNTNLSGYFSAAYSTGVWKKTSAVTVYAHWSKIISSLTNSISPTSYIYDGTAKTPTPTVKDGSTTLTNNTDYSVSYTNNTNVGTATATITGKNVYNATTKAYYTGSTTINFAINNAKLTFDKGTCAIISGVTTLYTKKGATGVYTGIQNTTAGTIPTASKTGYTFQGWYNASSNGAKVLNANGSFTGTAVTNYTTTNAWNTTANQTLYAVCTPNTYTVTANANGGTIASTTGWTGTGNTATKSVAYASAYGTLPTVSKTGYTFRGWSLLPEGYTQVEYIQSTGTQYIDTGAQIFDKSGHEIIIDFEPTEFYNYNQLFGSTTDANTFEGWIYSNGSLAARYNSTQYGTSNTIIVDTRYLVDLIKDNSNLYKYLDGVLFSGGSTSVATSTATGTLTLFKSGSDYSKLKLYGTKLYANGELVRDYVPCINDSTGKAGLFDLVTNAFYGNAGTGDFITGETSYITASTIVEVNKNHNIYAHWSINNPATPTISGGATKVYGSGATTLTCATTTNYATGTTKSYSFGYATSDGGTPSNWTTYSTSNTLSISATEYVGQRWYSCKVKASDGVQTTSEVASATTADTEMTINNAKITWDANSCGTISGTSPAYVRKGTTGVYTGIRNSTAGTMPTVSQSGYTFGGWYDGTTKVINADGSIVASVSNWTDSSKKWLITVDKTLKASCTRSDFTITYTMNNGTNNANNPNSYNVESAAITLAAPTKILTFKGNYNATSGANASSASGVTIGANTTQAQTFAGWTGSNGNTPQTSVTIPTGSTGDKSYTAHWTAVAGNTPTVTRTGYTCGWSTSSTGTTIEIASGGSYATSRITEGMSATVNLYAVCTPNDYTITYNYNNTVQITFANGESADTGYIVDWDKDFTISGVWKYPTASRAYLVIGNYDDGDKTLNIELTTANKFRVLLGNGGIDDLSSTTVGLNTNITYAFNWEASTNTYTFTATGTSTNISMTGTYNMSGQSTKTLRIGTRDNRNTTSTFTTTTYHTALSITKMYTFGETLTNPTPVTKPQYTFNGWFTAATGGNEVTNSTVVPSQDTTYYAQWTANTYTVKYNANGGTGTMEDQTFTYDVSQRLRTNTFTRDGYTFIGWTTNATGASTPYYDNMTVSNLTKTNNGIITMYAQWRKDTYDVTFYGNGSTSGSMSNQTLTYGTTGTLTANAYSKTGYTFDGWNTNTTGTAENYDNQDSMNINGNLLVGTSNPTLPTNTTSYAMSGRWGKTSTTLAPSLIDVTDLSSLITKGINIPANTTSSVYDVYLQNMIVKFDQYYTISVYAKGSGTLQIRTGNSSPYRTETFTLTNTWQRYEMKFMPKSGTTAGTYNARSTSNRTHIYFRSAAGNGAIQIAGVKLEVGEVATEYVDSSDQLNLHAKWTGNSYTIGYTMNGGPNPSTKPTSGIYDEDVQITNPGSKTFTVTIDKNGTGATVNATTTATQTFSGWTSTTLGSNAMTGANASSYAAWTGTSTKNTYFKNLKESGTVTMVANWNAANATLPSITKNGYSCKYNTKDDGTGTDYAIGASYATSTTTNSATLYVICEVVPYTITYALNNGTNNSNNPSTYNVESSAITLAAPTKTLTFKGNANATSGANAASGTVTIGSNTTKVQTFAGWTGSNGTTAQTTVTIPTGSTGDKNYTAHWTAEPGTLPTVTRTGYVCGWSTSSTGTTATYESGGTFPTSAITEGMAATVNLYAVCTPNTYTIGYTMNGGPNPSTKPTSGTYDANVNISNPGNKTVTITGNANNTGATVGAATTGTQTFSGWTSTTMGSNAKTGSSTSNYAAWTGSSTKNTYFKNLRESGTVTMVANWSGTATLPTLSKTGYTCKWYDDATGGNEMGASGATWTIPSDSNTSVTAYARCTINSYTLTLNPNGGSFNGTTSNTTVTQNYGTTYSVSNNPTRTGYVFTGWTKSGTGTYNYYDNSVTPTSMTTLNYDSASSTLPNVYNNKGNGTVTREMVADSTATGGYSLKITTNGEANPNAGGIVPSLHPTTPSRVVVIEVKAKIPSGYNLNAVSGNLYQGTGSTYRSDDRTGNGNWKTYYLVYYYGDTGGFGSATYLYLSGTDNTSVTWYVDYIKMLNFSRENFKSKFTFGAGNGTLTANWATSGSKVSFKPNGGTFNTTYVKSWTNNYFGVNATNADRFYRYDTAYGTHPGETVYDWTPDTRVISRTGHTFDGWYTAETGGTQIFDVDGKLKASVAGYSDANSKWIKYDSNVTLYARWIPIGYTVTYNTEENGGTGTIASQTVAFGNSIPLPTTGASKSGWTFVGWNTDKNATTALSSLTMGADNVTLYAIYRKEAVTLTANWNANGATLSSTTQSTCTLAAVYNKETQATSCTVTAPTITRANYDIIGFNDSASATTNNSSYNTSTKKLTLTSSNTGKTWYAITRAQAALTATFAANNGATVSTTTASCYLSGTATSCQVDVPTVTPQSGFTHIGFNTSASSTSNNSNYNTSTKKLTISNSGTWYPITRSSSQYSGTFTIQDTNAATQSGGSTSCYRYNGGTSCNITAPILTAKSGYTAVGWDKTATSSTATYASGASISINGNTQFYSITYYNTTVAITFNRNTTNSKAINQTPKGGTASTEATVIVTCNKMNGSTTCKVTSPTMEVMTGYHAVGYATSASATTSSWNQDTAKDVSTNATYYAITAGNTYSIKFNANCPTTASGSMDDLSMVYGTPKNLTANGFSCSARVFDGWALNAQGTGTSYENQEQVSNLTTTNGATVNLYAKWRLAPPSPTISGGTTKIYGVSATTLTCTENTTYSTPGVNKYYSFGYATSSTGTPSNWSDVSTSNTRTISADAYIGVRYYYCRVYASDGTEVSDTVVSSNKATMTLKNATITFNANGCGTVANGTSPAYVNTSMTGVYTGITNTTVGTMPSTSKLGYTFTGWYAESGKTTKVVNGDGSINASVANWTGADKKWLFTTDKVLYGSCSRDTYTITYAMNNGTNNANNPSTYHVESNAITIQAPTKTLTFKGNYNATSGANASSTSGITIGSDTTKAQTFAGWTGSNGTTAQTSVTIPTGSIGNKNYTAHWTAVAGTVPTVSRTGYTCGWSTSSTGTTVQYASGATFPTSAITEGMSATVNLYAVCTPNTYEITLDKQGGSGGTTTIYETYSVGYYLDAAQTNQMSTSANGITIPTKTNYVFYGYYTEEDGGTEIITSTGKLASGASTTQFSADGTLYARWEPLNYTITYVLNGGTADNPTSYTKETPTFTLTRPEREGYTFVGWTGTGLNATTLDVEIAQGSTGNREYTATWTANSYYLNLISLVNSIPVDDIGACGTADVYINGNLVSNDATNYHTAWVTGTTYTISDIKATANSGCTYTGETSYSGTITGANVDVNIPYTFTSRTFNYTGGMQSFKVPATGSYRLEVWGAQGGTSSSHTGGLGGYTNVSKCLTAGTSGDTLYIGVGGTTTTANGGWNGGGCGNGWNSSCDCGAGVSSSDYTQANTVYAAGGGGATHIGTVNAQLRNYASDQRNPNYIFAVAGGGGGGGEANNGGAGGKLNGLDGYGSYKGHGGSSTTSTGGAGGNGMTSANGSFGQGGTANRLQSVANGVSRYWAGGGGGGLYGGGGGDWSTSNSSKSYSGGGGGGSGTQGLPGYPKFGGTGTAGSDGVREGNGQAIITWEGQCNSSQVTYHDITLNYNVNQTFAAPSWMNTYYTPDWSKSFDIDVTFTPGTSGKRYIIFSNYDTSATNAIGLEINTSNQLRIYVGNSGSPAVDNAFGSVTIGATNTVHAEWNANIGMLTITASGGASGTYVNYIPALTGTGTRSLKFGAFDYREGTSNIFESINVSNFVITEHYASPLSSAYTLPDPAGHYLLFNGWTGSNGNTPQYGVTLASGATSDVTYTANWTGPSSDYTFKSYVSSRYSTKNVATFFQFKVDLSYIDKARRKAYTQEALTFIRTQNFDTTGYSCTISVKYNGTSYSRTFTPALYGNSSLNFWTRSWNNRNNTFEEVNYGSDGTATVSFQLTGLNWHSGSYSPSSFPQTYTFTLPSIAPAS